MIIINSGMPKAGTSLLVRYQRDLIAASYPNNGISEVYNRFKGFVDTIDAPMADTLRKIHDGFGPFAIKTHSEPTAAIRDLIETGIAKASFSFRDPRDTVLSALDHAARSRKGLDPTGAFSNLCTMQDAVYFTRGSIKLYSKWKCFGSVLFVRYEEFMLEKLNLLKIMAEYFNIRLSNEQLNEIYIKHELAKETAWNFNKGTTDRWKTELSSDDLALCDSVFGKELVIMGYNRVSETCKSNLNIKGIINIAKQYLKQ